MNDPITPEREQELSRKFDSDDLSTLDEHERIATDLYRQIKDGLQQYRTPEFDVENLREALRHEMKPLSHAHSITKSSWFPSYRVLRFAACFLMLLFVVYITYHTIQSHSIKTPPVQKFIVSGQENLSSLSWQTEIQKGRVAMIPSDTKLFLSDHSVITCTQGTRLSVQMEPERIVNLHRGKISLEVIKKGDSDFVISTPLLDVTVVGTTFEVEVY